MLNDISTMSNGKQIVARILDSRLEIVQLDSYLRDADVRVDRPQTKPLILRFFDNKPSDDIIEDEDDEPITPNKEDIVEAVSDFAWLAHEVSLTIGDRGKVVEYVKGFYENLTGAIKSSDDSDDDKPAAAGHINAAAHRNILTTRMGGRAILSSLWDPREVSVNSRSREFPVMIGCAITEWLAVSKY
jgi:hypothetical protein